MYLHLGERVVVNSKDVVAMLDLDTSTVSNITRNFLKDAEAGGQVITVSEELPKSAVVCKRAGGRKIYITQISTETLRKRSLTWITKT